MVEHDTSTCSLNLPLRRHRRSSYQSKENELGYIARHDIPLLLPPVALPIHPSCKW